MSYEYSRERINELEDQVRGVLANSPMGESMLVVISTLALFLTDAIDPPSALEQAIRDLRKLTNLYIAATKSTHPPKEKMN